MNKLHLHVKTLNGVPVVYRILPDTISCIYVENHINHCVLIIKSCNIKKYNDFYIPFKTLQEAEQAYNIVVDAIKSITKTVDDKKCDCPRCSLDDAIAEIRAVREADEQARHDKEQEKVEELNSEEKQLYNKLHSKIFKSLNDLNNEQQPFDFIKEFREKMHNDLCKILKDTFKNNNNF